MIPDVRMKRDVPCNIIISLPLIHWQSNYAWYGKLHSSNALVNESHLYFKQPEGEPSIYINSTSVYCHKT